MSSSFLLSGTIDLSNLYNYANQPIPNYINRDNTAANPIIDEGATLGRVLFYDKQLSSNNSIACASCHHQEFAFGDTSLTSQGVNGTTGRHSMRLINARFGDEDHFFWDERADSLEMQVTMPIKDHGEMGYSGTNGDPNFSTLLNKLDGISYYNDLFYAAYGDTMITEHRIQKALAQFIRSIQSFDSKFDVGRAMAANDGQPFSNFTQQENMGKNLFLAPPPAGGAGCAGCHRPPEFSIDPQSGNNGVIGSLNSATPDLLNTRAPTLRDLVGPNGQLNGPLMHNGVFTNLQMVIDHYNMIPNQPGNTNLDNRLRGGPGGQTQNLNLTQAEKDAIEAFLRTLTGSDVYTNPKWSNPFDANGNLTIVSSPLHTLIIPDPIAFQVFPNPIVDQVSLAGDFDAHQIRVIGQQGQILKEQAATGSLVQLQLMDLPAGVYYIQVLNDQQVPVGIQSVVKR